VTGIAEATRGTDTVAAAEATVAAITIAEAVVPALAHHVAEISFLLASATGLATDDGAETSAGDLAVKRLPPLK
jgi:hypothetical protein